MGIFNNPYTSTETWSAQGALMTWEGVEEPVKHGPMLILQVTAQFSRRIQAFYPIAAEASKRTKINMTGAPVGQLTIGGIFSPNTQNLQKFLEAVGAPCKTKDITCTIAPFGDSCKSSDWTAANTATIILKGIELESVGIQLQGGEVAVVNFPTTYSFTDMEIGPKQADNKNKNNAQNANQPGQ